MKSLTKLLLVVALAAGTAGHTFAKATPVVKTINQTTQDRHLSGFHAIPENDWMTDGKRIIDDDSESFYACLCRVIRRDIFRLTSR